MAFKFLVLKMVVSNTPSKISMMQKLYIAGSWGNFCYFCAWITQTVCFFHYFYYFWSSNYTLLGNTPPWKIKITKNLANIFCYILSKLCSTFTKRPLKITTLMAVFELISLILKLSFYETRPYKSSKIIQNNCFCCQ